MDDIKFLRWTLLTVIAASVTLFLLRGFTYHLAWLAFLVGGGYCVFSFVIYQLLLGAFVSKARSLLLQFAIVMLLMPLKLLALVWFAHHLSRQPGVSLGWHLAGLLIFFPVALTLARLQRDRGNEFPMGGDSGTTET